MPLTFAKKGAAKSQASDQDDETPKSQSKATASKTTAKASATGGASWLKTGQKAKDALVEEEAKAELAKEAAGKMWRFWMPPDDNRKITFLDGEIDEDGMLAIPMFHEHQVKVNGDWKNFVCTQESEGYCPICAKGESKAYLVGVMTVLDHSKHKIKSGPNEGKVITNTRKLFVAKKQTIRMLAKLAVKRDGLTGCTFDVSRGDDKTASVGSMFDFDEKLSLEEVMQKYGLTEEQVQPASVAEEVIYHTPEELVALGVGAAQTGPGYEKSGDSKKKLASEL